MQRIMRLTKRNQFEINLLGVIMHFHSLYQDRVTLGTMILLNNERNQYIYKISIHIVLLPLLVGIVLPFQLDRVLLSFSIHKVTPMDVELVVNVTKQSMVWCGAWPLGERMNFTALQEKVYGTLISGMVGLL